MRFHFAALLAALASSSVTAKTGADKRTYFQRIAAWPVCTQIDPDCNDDTETAAEIVTASHDGHTLLYTDSPMGVLGFVDISDPYEPKADGYIDVGGEPTSVAVCGPYAIVVVNTAEDFVNVSGIYHVIDVATKTVLRTDSIPGQPDSIGVSPDCTKAAIAIENERDEDLGDGYPPQMPAGSVVVLDMSDSDVMEWTTTEIDITGLPGVRFPNDPEPEYVSINGDNIAVVTLQENNAMVLIDTESMEVLSSLSAGSVDLTQVDATEEDIIMQTEMLSDVPREPDGVTWIDDMYYATADEGDLDGGSRGFTIFSKDGDIVFTSGNMMDHMTARLGHYPEGRSENKGNEPENVAYGMYGHDELLFVNSERSSLVFVFNVNTVSSPQLVQVLPAGAAPEGGYAIPDRKLLVVASEEDNRGDKLRSVINIYFRDFEEPSYPTLVSADRADGTPIPFSALSGLSACNFVGDAPCPMDTVYAVEDSFYNVKRVLTIDTSSHPAEVVAENFITDDDEVFKYTLEALGFDAEAISGLINDDLTINVDLEGIAVSKYGGFWLVHEGRDPTPNILFKISSEFVIEQVIALPDEINERQIRFGFEGVAEDGDAVVVVFQRAWEGFAEPLVGIWDTVSQGWFFVHYPLDLPESQAGGWVGLSDIAPLGGGYFLVQERDNQGGPDAVIKRLYLINLNEPSEQFEILNKYLVRDLYDDLASATNGPIVEKIEGLTVDQMGYVWMVNDNDGVDDNSGETLFMNLGMLHLDVDESGCNEVCLGHDCSPCSM